MSALRPSVATGNFPSAAMVEAAWRASAFNRELDLKLAVPASTLLDVLASEVLASSFVSPESRIGIVDKLLALQSNLGHGQEVVVAADEIQPVDRIATAAFAVLGACVVGAASAISVLTGNVIAIIIIAALVVISLPILLLGPQATEVHLGFGNFRLNVLRPRQIHPPSSRRGIDV